ncbi:hypothetical protein [Accumulibacter sp.]|uniref:hypothetical protein n=1 Tax=Accumulibacter sp. TaxID=2053492 RepID=UPI0025F648F7|nr:hypothetical protein [Accumulibacter sp.]MCM8594082.1 hypothetical protein [Accumulibacter sp.]MCM8624491.1 hypothetical protein [Accumulibacter sp.]MDS4048226.1 hypothetical protein [Accumulibacter sp.]
MSARAEGADRDPFQATAHDLFEPFCRQVLGSGDIRCAGTVEVGASPKALAPLLGHSTAEIATWVAGQAARTGCQRVVSGPRGSFPGLALGSGQELKAFLDAWREFARPAASTAILERRRIEKAAEDAGFDLTPDRDGACRDP